MINHFQPSGSEAWAVLSLPDVHGRAMKGTHKIESSWTSPFISPVFHSLVPFRVENGEVVEKKKDWRRKSCMVDGFCSRCVLFVVDTQNQSGCLTGKYRERILSRLKRDMPPPLLHFCLVDATVRFRALQLSRQQRTSNEIETWILDIKSILASPSHRAASRYACVSLLYSGRKAIYKPCKLYPGM